MAGIGFELRRLARRETLSSLVAAFGHAAVVAAGPWLFTILSLASITLITQPVIGIDTLSAFRIVVIYAFATSLVMTAPVTIVATRLLADALYLKQFERVRGLLFASYGLAVAAVVPLVLLLALYFDLPPRQALSLLAMSSVVGLIWVGLSFAGAVRDYAGVSASFAIGLLLAVLASIGAAVKGLGAGGMCWGFITGLVIILIGLTSRVLVTFPQPLGDPRSGLTALFDGLSRYRHLALGAVLGTAGVWVDKWVFWFSPVGETIGGGLVHAPLYDSAMFIASLVIIPSLATFVVKLETEFFDGYQRYFGIIQEHGTIQQIEAARADMARFTFDNLVLVTIVQAGLCAVVLLLAPAIVETLNLQFRQIAIMRYGTLGGVFQFVFIAATSILVFFDRRRLYLVLQALFFALNLGLTAITIALGEDYYGVGYFLACLVISALAYRWAYSTFADLNFLTFIGNNPTIRAATGSEAGTDRAPDRTMNIREMLLGFRVRRLGRRT